MTMQEFIRLVKRECAAFTRQHKRVMAGQQDTIPDTEPGIPPTKRSM